MGLSISNIINNVKVLKTSGLACQKLVDIQGQYSVWGNKKEKDSLVDLLVAIIDPYYRNIKDECNKNKPSWHNAWVQRLDEDLFKYASKDAYASYEMYTHIVDIWKRLRAADGK